MTQRLKILHIANINNDPTSGVSVVVPRHILSQQKHADTFLLNVRDEEIFGVENQRIYHSSSDLTATLEWFGKPDVAVFHEVYIKQYIGIAHQLRRLHIPYIILPHGCLTATAQQKSKYKKIAGNLLFFNRFIKNAIAIQCLSAVEQRETKWKNTFVATNGIQIPEQKKTAFSDDKIRMLYIGRLDAYHKGLDLLLAAVRICKPFLLENNCRLYIYGPDVKGRFAHLEQLVAENGVGELVELHHEICGEEKEAELLRADCFIQVSRFEGMPVGILEALSYGLPCLVSEGTGLGAMIRDADMGWTCETNAEAVAQMMQTAVRDRAKFAEKSENAAAFIKENFDWEQISSGTVKAYEKQLAKK